MSAAPLVKGDKIRWGIIGCGKISHDFVNAIKHLDDVELVGCAARNLSSAQEFAQRFKIAHAYGSYQELVSNPSIDVVYIGTLHPQHAEHTTLCLEHNKHVLCEKPMAVNAKQSERVIALAKEKGLFLMEAMWTRFMPAHAHVRKLLDEGRIGRVTMVQASFGFWMRPNVDRLWKNEHAGGTILDLGVYPITLANQVFGARGKKPPTKITAVGDLSEGEKIDTQTSITLQYGSRETAVLSTSFHANLPNEAWIIGEQGTIHIPAHNSFHCAQGIVVKMKDGTTETFDFPQPKREDQYEFKFMDSQLMVHECLEVHRCLREGRLQSDIVPLEESLAIVRIMDECRRQIGVVYKEDQ